MAPMALRLEYIDFQVVTYNDFHHTVVVQRLRMYVFLEYRTTWDHFCVCLPDCLANTLRIYRLDQSSILNLEHIKGTHELL